MSLKLLVASLQSGLSGAPQNLILQVAHAALTDLDDLALQQQKDLQGLKQMIASLEHRLLYTIEAQRGDLQRQLLIIGTAVQRLEYESPHPQPSGNHIARNREGRAPTSAQSLPADPTERLLPHADRPETLQDAGANID